MSGHGRPIALHVLEAHRAVRLALPAVSAAAQPSAAASIPSRPRAEHVVAAHRAVVQARVRQDLPALAQVKESKRLPEPYVKAAHGAVLPCQGPLLQRREAPQPTGLPGSSPPQVVQRMKELMLTDFQWASREQNNQKYSSPNPYYDWKTDTVLNARLRLDLVESEEGDWISKEFDDCYEYRKGGKHAEEKVIHQAKVWIIGADIQQNYVLQAVQVFCQKNPCAACTEKLIDFKKHLVNSLSTSGSIKYVLHWAHLFSIPGMNLKESEGQWKSDQMKLQNEGWKIAALPGQYFR